MDLYKYVFIKIYYIYQLLKESELNDFIRL